MLTGESTLSETALDLDAGAEDLDTQAAEEEAEDADAADALDGPGGEIDADLDAEDAVDLDTEAEDVGETVRSKKLPRLRRRRANL